MVAKKTSERGSVLLRSRPGDRARPSEPTLIRSFVPEQGKHEPVLLRPFGIAWLIVLFLALLFLIPARLVISGLGAAGHPSVAVALLLGLLWLAAFLSADGLPVGRQPVRWFVGIFLASGLISYAAGYARGLAPVEARAADRWLIATVAMCGLVLAVCDGLTDRASVDRVLRRLTQFAAAMSVVGLIQAIFRVNLVDYITIPGLTANSELLGIGARGSEDLERVAGTANHFVEFGVVLAMVLPVAIHFAMVRNDSTPPWRRWLVVGIIGAGIPFAISRAAMLSAAVALIVLALAWPWRARIKAAIAGCIAIAIIHVMQPGIWGTIGSLFVNASKDPSVQNRLADYVFVQKYFSERPWIGRGSGTLLPDRYILLDNQFLYTLVTAGILGVVAFAALILGAYFLCRGVRQFGVNQENRHLGQALAGSLAAAFVASGTYDSLSFATFTGVLCVTIGIAGALWRIDREIRLVPGYAAISASTEPCLVSRSLVARWYEFVLIGRRDPGR